MWQISTFVYVLGAYCLDVILPTPEKWSQKYPSENVAISYRHVSKISWTIILWFTQPTKWILSSDQFLRNNSQYFLKLKIILIWGPFKRYILSEWEPRRYIHIKGVSGSPKRVCMPIIPWSYISTLFLPIFVF